MRNRRNILIAFLLCASILVGVGYAKVVDVMDITGSAEYNMDDSIDSNVEFTDAEAIKDPTSGMTENTASVTTTNADKASFTVHSVKSDNDVAFFKFTITNKNASEVFINFKKYTASEEAKDVYDFKYAFDTTSNLNYTQIASLTYTNATAAEAEHTEMLTVPAADGENPGTAYVYVRISFVNNQKPNITGDQILSESFVFEMNVANTTND